MTKITQIKDSIVTLGGANAYKINEQYKLSKNTFGIVLTAKEKEAKLLVVGDPSEIKVNSTATKISSDSNIELYDHYFGKIISPFGQVIHPANFKAPAKKKLLGKSPRLNKSPSIINRKKLSSPLRTGILTIDTMIPIGKGQRELIIGDRSTGKSHIALAAMINQKNEKVKSIYVAIGQKRNSVISFYNLLEQEGALKDSVIIFANPDSASEQFLAPTIGMAMAEVLAYKGEDVLIIVDDLTKHANVYREISLSVGKNPGREAYPTDIFYQHSSLLERSGKFSKEYNEGTITCLPIVETVQGDLASLIPSNIISITDGQIFTNSDQFNKGLYPAINVQLSVSRTGSSVQSEKIKLASKNLKAEHAELSEIKKFADMSIDITDTLMKKIKRWDGINNLLVQFGYDGYSEDEIILLIKLFRMGLISDVKKPVNFSQALKNLLRKDDVGKKILKDFIEDLKDYDKHNDKIEFFFGELSKIASNKESSLFSQKEFNILKGSK